MNTFFYKLDSKGLIPELSRCFDWLLSDERFQKACWDKTTKGRFTKALRKLDGMDAQNFNRKSKNHKYPVFASKRNRKKRPHVVISSNGSLGVDLVRHIRNGIAHGNANLYSANGTDYVEIYDYKNRGQTAYIALPISYLNEIFRIYQSIEAECTGC